MRLMWPLLAFFAVLRAELLWSPVSQNLTSQEPVVELSWSSSSWNYSAFFVTAKSEIEVFRQQTSFPAQRTDPIDEIVFDRNTINISFDCILSADYLVGVSVWGLNPGGAVDLVGEYFFRKACEDPLCPTCKAGICGAFGDCSCPNGTSWQLPSCDFQDTVPQTICPLDFITGTFRFLPPEEGGDSGRVLDWLGLFPDYPLIPSNNPFVNTFAYILCNSELPCEGHSGIEDVNYTVSLGLHRQPLSRLTWGHMYNDGYDVVQQGQLTWATWQDCGLATDPCSACISEHTDPDLPCNSSLGCPCLRGFFGPHCERGCDGIYELNLPASLNLDQSDLSDGTQIGYADDSACAFHLVFDNWDTMDFEFEFLDLGNGDTVTLFQLNDTITDLLDFNESNVNVSSQIVHSAKNVTLNAKSGKVVYLLFTSNSYGSGRGMKLSASAVETPANLYLLVMLPVLVGLVAVLLVVLLIVFLVALPKRRAEKPPDFAALVVTRERQLRLEDSLLAFSSMKLRNASRQLKKFKKHLSGDQAPQIAFQMYQDQMGDRFAVEDFVDLLFESEPKQVPPFLLQILEIELESLKNQPLSGLFRMDSAFTSGYGRYLHLVGMPFLWATFHQLLNDLKLDRASSGSSEMNLEIDPNKNEELQGAVLRLKIFARALLFEATNCVDSIPAPIVDLTRRAYKTVVKVRGKTAKTLANQLVSNLIFLRFVSQALVNAEQWGISREAVSSKLRRNLVLVTKVLQTAANEDLFDDSNFMSVMNAEALEYREPMQQFCKAFLKDRKLDAKELDSFEYPVQIAASLRDAALKDLVVQAVVVFSDSSASSGMSGTTEFLRKAKSQHFPSRSPPASDGPRAET